MNLARSGWNRYEQCFFVDRKNDQSGSLEMLIWVFLQDPHALICFKAPLFFLLLVRLSVM